MRIDESMTENEVMHSHKESMERQIEALYARVNLGSPGANQSNIDQGVSSSEIATFQEHLAELENERNLLLDYVQNDMEKSSEVEKEKNDLFIQLEKAQRKELELKKEINELRSLRSVQSSATSPMASPNSSNLRSPSASSSSSSLRLQKNDEYKEKYDAAKVEVNNQMHALIHSLIYSFMCSLHFSSIATRTHL